MPTYEYRCPEGHDFEHFVLRISEASSTMACPTCGNVATRQISAGGGLLFKGSGFYITDYGKDGKKDLRAAKAASTAAKGGESSAVAAASSTESASSDSKSAEVKSTDAKSSDARSTDAKPAKDKKEPKAAAPAPSGSADS